MRTLDLKHYGQKCVLQHGPFMANNKFFRMKKATSVVSKPQTHKRKYVYEGIGVRGGTLLKNMRLSRFHKRVGYPQIYPQIVNLLFFLL